MSANPARKRRQPGDGKAAEEKKQAAKDKKAVEDIDAMALMQIVKRPLTPPSPAWRWYPGGKRAVTSSD